MFNQRVGHLHTFWKVCRYFAKQLCGDFKYLRRQQRFAPRRQRLTCVKTRYVDPVLCSLTSQTGLKRSCKYSEFVFGEFCNRIWSASDRRCLLWPFRCGSRTSNLFQRRETCRRTWNYSFFAEDETFLLARICCSASHSIGIISVIVKNVSGDVWMTNVRQCPFMAFLALAIHVLMACVTRRQSAVFDVFENLANKNFCVVNTWCSR